MRRVGTEKTDLSVKRFDFIGGKKLDGSVLSIEARRAGHLPAPQAADAFFHTRAGRTADVLQRRLARNIKLRPKLLQKRLIPRGDLEA